MAQSQGALGATKSRLWQCLTFPPGITYLGSMFISEVLMFRIKLLIAGIRLSYISGKAKSL